MKKTLTLLLGLWSLLLHANSDYKVVLKTGEQLSCRLTVEKSQLYHCVSGDRFVLISPVGAVGNLKGSKQLAPVDLKEIFNPQGEKITDKVMMFPSLNPSAALRDEASWSLYLFGFTNVLAPADRTTSEEYSKIKKQFDSLLEQEKARIGKALNSDEYLIGVPGQKKELSCKRLRLTTDPIIKNQLTTYFGADAKCGISRCGDGKFLFTSPIPGSFPEVVSLDKNGNWKFEFVQKLSAKGGSRPLMDFSMMSNPYAAAMSSGIAGGAGGGGYADYSSYSGASHVPQIMPEISWEHYVPKQFRNNGLFIREAFNSGSGYFEGLAQLCHSKDVAEITQSLKNYQDRLGKTEMVQYITEVNDVLVGHLISPDKIPANACNEDGTYIRTDIKDKARSLRPQGPGKTISLEEAKKLFRLAQGMDDIAWNYKEDGCYARAHLMARRFEEMGYTVDKAWIKGSLEVEAGDAKIQWNFHVAPVVYVKDEKGKVLPYVIDPSIMEAPVPAESWAGKMTKKLPGGVVKSQYPFPMNVSMYNRAALAFSGPSPYLPNDPYSMTEDEKMKLAVETMKEYKGY